VSEPAAMVITRGVPVLALAARASGWPPTAWPGRAPAIEPSTDRNPARGEWGRGFVRGAA
jgi:hypothetical protein